MFFLLFIVLGMECPGAAAARVTSVLRARLAAARVDPAMTHHALAHAALVGQLLSLSPVAAVAEASHAAYISPFHLAILIGGVVAFLERSHKHALHRPTKREDLLL
jgi:hypothetical protein